MKIEIFDVQHGQCAMIACPPYGKKIMIDAGHSSGNWWPSVDFYDQEIEQLIITNYDEDHTSDVVDVRYKCRLKSIMCNFSISATALRQMKSTTGGMGKGVKDLHDWLTMIESTPGGLPVTVDFGGQVTINHYCVKYPIFTDANNLSLVSFVSYAGFTILFPGDLEKKAWKELLKSADFRRDVQRTTILVASHHGRENGCCEELYTLTGWTPYATIISDAGKEHATQETVAWYANRTHGCSVVGETRQGKVFTTRRRGKITINVSPNGNWTIGSDGTTRQQERSLSTLLGASSTFLGQL